MGINCALVRALTAVYVIDSSYNICAHLENN
jgi:hypothetical protein